MVADTPDMKGLRDRGRASTTEWITDDESSATVKTSEDPFSDDHAIPRGEGIRRVAPRSKEKKKRRVEHGTLYRDKTTPRYEDLPRVEFSNVPTSMHPTLALPVKRYFIQSLHWILSFLGTVMSILQIPFAVVLSLYAIYWLFYTIMMLATPKFCELPGITFLEICRLPTELPGPPETSPFIQTGLDYSSKLEEMQKLGADSVELPYHLRIGEGGVRGMIVQLSAVDLPSKQKLMPLLHEYSDLADRSIDGLQDWLSRIDQVVDRTILINSWAEAELQRIEERDGSLMAPINNLVNKVFGSALGLLTTEGEVREAFFGLTEQVQVQVAKVVVEAQRYRGNLVELKAVLDNIAIAALGDASLLRREKLSQQSYWRWILREHRDKMAEFDSKMEMCAAFYRHTEQALTVISTTQIKMQQMRGQLIVFRDGLADAPLMIESGKTVSLRLYIDTLKAGVNNLEATRKSTKLLKAEKMRQLEESMKN